MSQITMHLVQGPRKRSVALSDSPLVAEGQRSASIRISPEDLTEYLQAKATVDKWQERFRHQRRYGWSY